MQAVYVCVYVVEPLSNTIFITIAFRIIEIVMRPYDSVRFDKNNCLCTDSYTLGC